MGEDRHGIAYNTNTHAWVAVGNKGVVLYSTDMITWTQKTVNYNNGTVVEKGWSDGTNRAVSGVCGVAGR